MSQLEQDVREAHRRLLAAGYKPEDYLTCGPEYPMRLARVLVDEVRHIRQMRVRRKQLEQKGFRWLM